MNVWITGITGFAGSHLAEHLVACGDRVAGSSRNGRWPAEMTGEVTGQVPVCCWDVAQPAGPAVRQQLAALAPHWIFHLAAVSVPARCGRQQPLPQAWATNVQGTRNVLQLAATLPSPPRVLLASSCHVYAPVSPDQPPLSEQAPLGPQAAYGKTKLEAEQVGAEALRQWGLEVVIARAFQHTGPGQSALMMLPQWIEQFVRGSDPVRVVSLDSFLDLTDVRDTVRAYRALLVGGRPGEIYNVGSGVCRRSGDIFEWLRNRYDAGRKVIELAPGRRQHPIADIARLVAATAWQPVIPLEQTLEDTWGYWQHKMETHT